MGAFRENMDISVLNAVENAILKYGKDHGEFIKNSYWFFSEALGYKAKNYIYDWFKKRNGAKIGYDDLMKILEKTNSLELAEAIKKDIEMKINRELK